MPRPTKSKLAELAIAALEDLKGIDIKLIDVARHTTVTEWWVLCTGTSNRHVRSLAENVVEKAKAAQELPRSVQGIERSEWVVVDLGSVVVHVFQVQSRAHYQLEKLIPEMMPLFAVPPPPKDRPAGRKGGKGKKAGKSSGKGSGKKFHKGGKQGKPARSGPPSKKSGKASKKRR